MHSPLTLTLLLSLLPFLTTAETVLGIYIFSRHGDRTSKSTPPVNLTTLGYSQIFTSGSYFRSRYISSSASTPIYGLSPNLVNYKQIFASAPLDTSLMPSAQGFLQGLYPPVGGRELGEERLRDGREVQAPLDGYQLIPIQTVTTGTASEDSAWLQGAGNCANAIASSNAYFGSREYDDLLRSTGDFYKSLAPVVNATFNEDDLNYRNAYAIYDLINVATIHNTTVPSFSLLTPSTLTTLSSLASTHEFNLAYNSTDPIRAIAGSTLAAQVVQALNTTLSSPSHAPKINIEFGAYGAFQSFFGLAGLTSPASPADASNGDGVDFQGIPDYASTLTFELVTNSSTTPFPSPSDVSVRFLFHNGTTSNTSIPTTYPLFGQSSLTLPWTDFVSGMNEFAVGDQGHWCTACGNSTGVCAASWGAVPMPGKSVSGGGGLSRAAAGVLGAMVTLAVILGVEAAVMLGAGLRVVSKRRVAGEAASDGMEKAP